MQGKDEWKGYSEEECQIDISLAKSFLLTKSYLGISFGE